MDKKETKERKGERHQTNVYWFDLPLLYDIVNANKRTLIDQKKLEKTNCTPQLNPLTVPLHDAPFCLETAALRSPYKSS